MQIMLEDVIKLLKEVEETKTKLALIPHELVNKQYALLGAVDGVRECIRKIENFYERESYTA